MIISHSKKFIFIHIYKVAGTSIGNALRNYNFLPSKLNKLKVAISVQKRPYSNEFASHITTNELLGKVPPKIFSSYFKFAFVRNPWDWQVSLYHFAKQKKTHRQHDIIKKMSFEDYINWRIYEDLHLQSEFVCDQTGKLLVDYVGKFENLQKDFDEICRQINVPSILIPKKNISLHEDYRKYYNSNTRELVLKAFHKDITTFDYRFD